jgi:uncharacterized protein (DUF2336 family)
MAKPLTCVPLDSLVDLACRDGVDIRPTLLRVLTDLYVQRANHSAEEENQYVELALGLIDVVDEKTRATVAHKLDQYPQAPEAVVKRLAPARLSAAVNADSELIELFFFATPEERRLILVNLDIAVGTSACRPRPTASELVRRLEQAALKRDVAEFSRVLERALDIGRELAQRISRDRSGEPLVVAAKALGMTADILQRILLFLNPEIGQSARALYALNALFADMTDAAAERMLQIWRAGSTLRRPSHEPVYWDDERPGHRTTLRQPQGHRQQARVQRPTRIKTSQR